MRLLLASVSGLLVADLLCLAAFWPITNLSLFLGVDTVWALFLAPLPVIGLPLAAFVAALLRPGAWVERSAAVLWLGLLPAAGFIADALVDPCTDPCGGPYQPVAWPGAWLVLASYGLGLLAWVVHQRRPAPLPWHLEAPLLAALAQGVATCMVTSAQFGPALAATPLAPPLIAPAVASLVFTWAVGRRLLNAGWAAGATGSALSVAWMGLWVVSGSVFRGALRPYAGAFTDTCGWTMSQMSPPPGDCHYLCTIAAQGHPWLVRPQRRGQRRGRPIVVNRQLAVANAFEDLLHERWPRLGAWARRTYDRLARDISGPLSVRWVADVLFVAMLPAQGLFELVLLLADPGDPEARVARMYRPRAPSPPR